jgi:hypothetical protein
MGFAKWFRAPKAKSSPPPIRTTTKPNSCVPGQRVGDLCPDCGHAFDKHRLVGSGPQPTEGWMECPVEGCVCKMTWSADADVARKLEAVFKPLTD